VQSSVNSSLKSKARREKLIIPDGKLMKDSRGKKIPLLYSAFNNWQGQPMVKLVNFVRTTDKRDPPDILKLLKERSNLRDHIYKLEDMRPWERKAYEKEKIEQD